MKTPAENSKNPNPENPTANPTSPNPACSESASSSKDSELLADLQRTRADFENYRKNVEKDKETLKNLTKLATVEKFLPLLDDLDRALKTYKELKPLEKNFEKTLKSLNLELMKISETTEFNPEFHEAVLTEGDGERETIAEVLRPGYLYEGSVLRPAMVKVKLV